MFYTVRYTDDNGARITVNFLNVKEALRVADKVLDRYESVRIDRNDTGEELEGT